MLSKPGLPLHQAVDLDPGCRQAADVGGRQAVADTRQQQFLGRGAQAGATVGAGLVAVQHGTGLDLGEGLVALGPLHTGVVERACDVTLAIGPDAFANCSAGVGLEAVDGDAVGGFTHGLCSSRGGMAVE
uniref:Uncharacterized protein n=1 Tax=Steinernema glaseri TaxID=37863 RepID=A0A1I8AMH0_9BILA